METVAYFWTDYIRLNLWWVFFLGVAVVIYRTQDRWLAYVADQRALGWRSYALEAANRAVWPIALWMIAFGLSATILDAMLGAR